MKKTSKKETKAEETEVEFLKKRNTTVQVEEKFKKENSTYHLWATEKLFIRNFNLDVIHETINLSRGGNTNIPEYIEYYKVKRIKEKLKGLESCILQKSSPSIECFKVLMKR